VRPGAGAAGGLVAVLLPERFAAGFCAAFGESSSITWTSMKRRS
jgi:hypothetical protein